MPSTSTTVVVPAVLISSSPSSLETTSAFSAPRRASAPAIVSRNAGSETPMTWRAAPAGLVSGPRKLKIVRTASSLRTGITWRVAPWCAGANMKPKPASSMQRRDRVGGEVDAHAERLEQVGRAGQPGGRAVAVLGHRAARAGGDQRGGGGDVEGRAPAAGAGGVDQVVALGGHRRGEPPHRRGEADELVDRLALGAQRDQHRGDLGLRRVAGHDLGEHAGGLLGGEVAARGQRVDRLGQHGVRQGTSPAAACRRA